MANENQIVPRFYTHTTPNEAKSKQAGRPIYDDQEVCELKFAGNKQTVGVFPAHEVFKTAPDADGTIMPVTYAMAYSSQYLAFKNNEAQDLSGTPLAELPFLTQSKRMELKALNVHTAEALAAIDGTPLRQLGPKGREMKNQAQAYLDAAMGSSNVTQLAADNALKDTLIADLQAQIAEINARPRPAPEAAPEPEPEDDKPGSPFDDFEDQDIRNWIKDTTGDEPDKRLGRKKLIAAADEINAKLAAKNKVDA